MLCSISYSDSFSLPILIIFLVVLSGFLDLGLHPRALRSAPHIVFSLRCAYTEELRPAAEKK